MYLKCCDVFLKDIGSVFTGSSCLVWTSIMFVCSTWWRDLFVCFYRLEICLQSWSHIITNEIVTSRFTPHGLTLTSGKGSSGSLEYTVTACQLFQYNHFVRITVLGFFFLMNSKPYMMVHDPSPGAWDAKLGELLAWATQHVQPEQPDYVSKKTIENYSVARRGGTHL